MLLDSSKVSCRLGDVPHSIELADQGTVSGKLKPKPLIISPGRNQTMHRAGCTSRNLFDQVGLPIKPPMFGQVVASRIVSRHYSVCRCQVWM